METATRLLPQSKILQEWWSEVKENFWADDAKPQVLKLVKELMESTLKESLHYKQDAYRIRDPAKTWYIVTVIIEEVS